MMMGGQIKGGVYGSYPDFDLEDPSVYGSRGIFVPTMAMEQFLANAVCALDLSEEQIVNGSAGADPVFSRLAGLGGRTPMLKSDV